MTPKTLQTEIAIIGGGLSGLAAALTAAEAGITAIVLEKMGFLGGAGLFPEGSLGIGTRYQKQQGIQTTVDEVFARVMDFHHWRCNAAAIRTLLDASADTIDWLEDQGVEIEGIRTMFPPEKSLYTWHIFKGHGSRVVKTLTSHIREKNGTILKRTPATALLVSEKGVLTGVRAEDETGTALIIKARAVIIATGGFISNRKMLEHYVPDVSTPGMAKLMVRGPSIDGRTGDGINMARSVNAGLVGMGVLAGNSPYLDDEPAIHQFRGEDAMKQARCALSQPFLWINREGERFYNESLGSIFSDVYNAMTANGGLLWSIFDEDMKQTMIKDGPLIPFNNIVVPGQPMTALDRGIATGIEKGFAFRADTLDELAAQINVHPEKLIKTVASVNQYADQRYDPDFNRRPEHLIRFDTQKGPCYALKGLRAFFLTLGGVRINPRMQALNDQGKVIPGLYVTGQDMGGLYDTTYDLLAEGSASSFALSSGRIAVRSIIESL